MPKHKRQHRKSGRSSGRGQSARRAAAPGGVQVESDLPPELLALFDLDQMVEFMRAVCPICAEGGRH